MRNSRYRPFEQKPLFKIGDFVRLKNGWAPQQVIDVTPVAKYISASEWGIKARYVRNSELYNDPERIPYRSDLDYVLYEDNPHTYQGTPSPLINRKQEVTSVLKKFIVVSGNQQGRRGTYLNMTSGGQTVLEMDNGGVVAFEPNELAEIKPYIVKVKFFNGSSAIHYQTSEGSVTVGDLLKFSTNLGIVIDAGVDFNGNAPALVAEKVLTKAI